MAHVIEPATTGRSKCRACGAGRYFETTDILDRLQHFGDLSQPDLDEIETVLTRSTEDS
jgi:hypothetical protein